MKQCCFFVVIIVDNDYDVDSFVDYDLLNCVDVNA